MPHDNQNGPLIDPRLTQRWVLPTQRNECTSSPSRPGWQDPRWHRSPNRTERNCPIRNGHRTAATHGPDRLSRSGGAIQYLPTYLGTVGLGVGLEGVWANPGSRFGVAWKMITVQRLGSVPTTEIRAAWRQKHSRSSGTDRAGQGGGGYMCICTPVCRRRGVGHPPYSFILSACRGEKEEGIIFHGRSPANPVQAQPTNPRGQSGPRFRSLASGTRPLGLAGEWGGLTGAECRRLKRQS